MQENELKRIVGSPGAGWAAASLVAAAATAAWVAQRARRAERRQPPSGRILHVDGVRLHVVERGEGTPVVLIHGNAVSLRDFEVDDLIDSLAQDHRVIAFDRPGFGHSSRPRDRFWTPEAQAELLHAALATLGIERPVVVGHSLGAMVAMSLALNHPADVRRLVLLGGYYYPSARVDALMTAPVALPVVGDVLRYTVTALSARLMLNAQVKAMFAPAPVPDSFLPLLSREMLVRPVQLRASAEDAAFMLIQARSSSARHAELAVPVAIVAGAEDGVVDVEQQSKRLHAELVHSTLTIVPGAGHMVHHAAPHLLRAAIGG